MKLTAFRGENVFQHGKFDWPVTGNLIGVVGPNGSGKSNMLNTLRFALGGEVPGKTKDKLLRWGADSGYVEVEFEADKHAGTVQRSVSSNKAAFKMDPGISALGITKVDTALTQHLGLDKSILDIMFVQQAEIETILFDLASKREMSFQKLCGLGDTAKVYKVMGPLLPELFPPLPNYDEQIALAQVERATTEKRLEEFSVAEQQLLQQLAALPTDDEQQATRLRWQQTLTAVDTATTLRSQMYQLQTQLQQDQQAIAPLEAQTQGISLDVIDEHIRQTQATLDAVRAYQSRLQAWQQCRAQMDGLGNPPDIDQTALEQLRVALVDMQARYGQLTGSQQLYRDLLRTISGVAKAAECPLCGSKIADSDWLRARLKTKLEDPAVNQLAAQIAEDDKRYRDAAAAITAYQSKHRLLARQATDAEAALKAVVCAEGDVAQLTNAMQGMQAVRKEMDQLLRQRDQRRMRIQLVTEQLAKTDSEYRKLVQQLLALGTTADGLEKDRATAIANLQATDATMQQCQQVKIRLATVQGQLGEMRSSLERNTKLVTELERRRGQQDTYREVCATLESVRNWFHYAQGPHEVAVGVMMELTNRVNEFLDQLSAPFRVTAQDTDLSYRCVFVDGRTMPATGAPDAAELSGGQKILLAISFRLASYCMFANKQGLLSLDEPTVYLDENNIGNLCALLAKVKTVAQALDLQLFISTHERSLMPFFDTIIDLSTVEEARN